MKQSIFFIVASLVLLYQCTFAQSNVWPSYFSVPDTTETEIDTFTLSIYNKTSYTLDEQLKENAAVQLSRNRNGVQLTQHAEYAVDDYDSTRRDHFIDMSGEFLYPVKWLTGTMFGLQWSPIVNYKERPEERSFHSQIDLGPMLKTEFFHIPVMMKAGFTGAGWLDSMQNGVLSTPLLSYRGDPGIYGGCDIGKQSTSIGNIPLYINISAYGKSIRNVGSALVMGRALYLHKLNSGDTLFFYTADSLQNGKEIFFNKKRTETPWRLSNSFNAVTGFRAKDRFGFIPALLYNFRIGSVEYPSDLLHLNDMLVKSHLLNMQVETAGHYFFDYSGGLSIGWDYEDWVFRTKVDNNKRFLDSLDVVAKLNDHFTNIALSDHVLRVHLPRNLAFEYELHASKDSKVYDTLFTRNDTINNSQESDQIRIMHHGGFLLDTTHGVFLKAYTEYTRSYLYYCNRTMSQLSKKDENYRIGMVLNFSNDRIRVNENFFMEALPSEYVFKFSTNLPLYSRRVSSFLSCSFPFNKNFELGGSWTAMYNDKGKWYGKDYFDTIPLNGVNYYAIEKKTVDNIILIQAKLSFNRFNIISSVSFRNSYPRIYDFSTDNYIDDETGKRYTVEPWVELTLVSGFLNIEGKIGRMFNNVDVNRWSLLNNWDLSLTAKADF